MGPNRARKRLVFAVLPLVVVASVFASAACEDPNGESVDSARALIELHAFPNSVKPGGSAAVVLFVRGTCAANPSTCTVCLGLPPNVGPHVSGQVFWPGVIAGGDPNALQLSNVPLDQPITTTYRAPMEEGADVITATLFEGSVTCARRNPDAGDAQLTATGKILSSTSVRIAISSSKAADDAAATDDGSAESSAPDSSDDAPADAEILETSADTGSE